MGVVGHRWASQGYAGVNNPTPGGHASMHHLVGQVVAKRLHWCCVFAGMFSRGGEEHCELSTRLNPPSLGTLGILRLRAWPNSDIPPKHCGHGARSRPSHRQRDATMSHGTARWLRSPSPRAILHSSTLPLLHSTRCSLLLHTSPPVNPDNLLAPHGPLPTQFDAPQPHLTILHIPLRPQNAVRRSDRSRRRLQDYNYASAPRPHEPSSVGVGFNSTAPVCPDRKTPPTSHGARRRTRSG